MSLDRWIEEQRQRFEVPGMAVGIFQNGKSILQRGFGLRDVAHELPVTPGTAFAIGSSTKAFTAATVGALVDDGLLEWDTPVREYLPNFQMDDHIATECLTPRDLLCHRSGLPRHDLSWYKRDDLTRKSVVQGLRYLRSSKSFRSTWQYNNLMYITAGYLCEVLTGKSWEEHVRERLLNRLAMTATSFSERDSGLNGDVALPYAKRKGEVVQIPYAFEPDVAGPAGSIYSTLTDMTNWVRANLEGGRLGDDQVLSRATVEELHAPQMAMRDAPLFPEVLDLAYGLGWFIGSYRGRKVVHHGGNIDGFTAHVTMLPDEGIGLVILCNKDSTFIREALSYHVFDELLGIDQLPWGDRMNELETSLFGGMKEAKARAEKVVGTSPSHPLEDYVGEYTHPAYGTLKVELSDGALIPRFRAFTMKLVHRHYDIFDVEAEELEDIQLAASFSLDPRGNIASVSLPLEPTVDPIIFERKPDPMPAPEVCERLAGAYSLGPIDVLVEFTEPDRLTIRIPGGGPARLSSYRGLLFTVEGIQDATATFVLDDAGVPKELVLQPFGVLPRKIN